MSSHSRLPSPTYRPTRVLRITPSRASKPDLQSPIITAAMHGQQPKALVLTTSSELGTNRPHGSTREAVLVISLAAFSTRGQGKQEKNAFLFVLEAVEALSHPHLNSASVQASAAGQANPHLWGMRSLELPLRNSSKQFRRESIRALHPIYAEAGKSFSGLRPHSSRPLYVRHAQQSEAMSALHTPRYTKPSSTRRVPMAPR